MVKKSLGLSFNNASHAYRSSFLKQAKALQQSNNQRFTPDIVHENATLDDFQKTLEMSRNNEDLSDNKTFKTPEGDGAGGGVGNHHPLMNISEFPVHQNIVNKVAQQQQLKHLQQSSNSFGSRKASMLPNAISSAKSNPIVTVGMSSIIPLVSNK